MTKFGIRLEQAKSAVSACLRKHRGILLAETDPYESLLLQGHEGQSQACVPTADARASAAQSAGDSNTTTACTTDAGSGAAEEEEEEDFEALAFGLPPAKS